MSEPPQRFPAVARALLIGTAVCGASVIAEGLSTGLRQHRIFAAVAGAGLLLPALGFLAAGARGVATFRRALFAVVPLLVVLLLLEGVARIVDVETVFRPRREEHPSLGHRAVPGSGGLDAWGFRNEKVPERVDVVFVGDSHTYGFGVTRSQAYPAAFARASGLSTYNMSLGGYGPIQYLALTPGALELEPRALVVAFYLGNDLVDAERFLVLEEWADLRAPGQPPPSARTTAEERPHPRRNLAIRGYLAVERSSRLAGFAARQLRAVMRTNRHLAGLSEREPGAPHHDGEGIDTRFTPTYRGKAMDTRSAQVREGLRVSGAVLERIAARCASAGVRPLLLLLPTKESVYGELLRAQGEPVEDALATLCAREREVGDRLREAAARWSIPVLDPTPELSRLLRAGTRAYPASSDGHPTAAGHAAIAEALWERSRIGAP